jgi:hypothetical protein
MVLQKENILSKAKDPEIINKFTSHLPKPTCPTFRLWLKVCSTLVSSTHFRAKKVTLLLASLINSMYYTENYNNNHTTYKKNTETYISL